MPVHLLNVAKPMTFRWRLTRWRSLLVVFALLIFSSGGPQAVAQSTSAVATGAQSNASSSDIGEQMAQAARRPNIVFVLTDDLATNLVQYMPNVVQMQRRGVTFANYFVTDSLCCPSRASIFTGLYPHNTGVFSNAGPDGGYMAFQSRGDDRTTFATMLSAAGYRTAMLGKYLNGYFPKRDPVAVGWTSWAAAGNGYPGFDYNLNQDGKIVHYDDQPSDYLTDVVADLAVRFIKQSAGAPFFIEVATFAPHRPSTPAPRDADALPGVRAPRTAAFGAAPDANAPRWLVGMPALSSEDMTDIDEEFRLRAQSVLAVNKMIGELQAAVAATGQENNTYFVFSSDNGYHMGEYRLLPGKMTPYEADIHVPLIVTGPGVPAGVTIGEIAQNTDLAPTFIELGGALPAASMDGRSLVPLLQRQQVPDWRTVALVEHHGPLRQNPADPDAMGLDEEIPPSGWQAWRGGRGGGRNRPWKYAWRNGNPTTYEAIRGPTWVYVEYADDEKEYHDLATDPDELRNSFSLLSSAKKASLHAALAAVQACRGAQSCRVAERSPVP